MYLPSLMSSPYYLCLWHRSETPQKDHNSSIRYPRNYGYRNNINLSTYLLITVIPNYLIVAGLFDVYNIETAMPNFDLEAIECHLKAAKEEEQRVSFFFTIL